MLEKLESQSQRLSVAHQLLVEAASAVGSTGRRTPLMASSSEYDKLAAECTRMAQAAPCTQTKASFAAAASYWNTLSQLTGASGEKRKRSPRRNSAKPDAMATKRGG
jgi:hypothetical protein